MKTITMSLILLYIYQPFTQFVQLETKYKYWFLPHIAERESDHYSHAISKDGLSYGVFQISIKKDGGLAHWNNHHPNEQYLHGDLFDPDISLKIATFLTDDNLRMFDGCIVKAINSYNMGAGNTRKDIYFMSYCVDIIGGMMAGVYFNDYTLIKKSENKKAIYIKKRTNE